MRLAAALFLVLFLLPSLAYADQLKDGLAAHAHKDYQLALKLLQPLADQGKAAAQEEIGYMYENGEGVKQDYAEAMKWYMKAADQGDARTGLDRMYLQGEGVQQDYLEGLFWETLSARDWRQPPPQLGTNFTTDQKIALDRRVHEWFFRQADRGNANAQIEVAIDYIHGQGVARDNAEAYFWLRLAANLVPNSDSNRKGSDNAATLLTPEEKAAVDKRVEDWMTAHPTAVQDWTRDHPFYPTY